MSARARPPAVTASAALLVLLVIAALAGLTVPMPEAAGCCAAPPSLLHPLGTANDGRDLVLVVAKGLATTTGIGVGATLLALLIGVAWGAVAALQPPRIEQRLMRFVDLLSAAPATLFAILTVLIVHAAKTMAPHVFPPWWDDRVLLVVAVAAVEWLTLARVVHARIAALRQRGFVEAARSLGMSRWRVLRTHMGPHAVGPLVAYTVLAIPSACVTEGLLSVLGFGVMAPEVSLGTLLASGTNVMSVAPLAVLIPAATFVAMTVALHVVGAWLRDGSGRDAP